MKPFKTERVTKGGIVIPESEAEKRDLAGTKATVVAVGSLAFEAERRHEMEFNRASYIPQPGDVILMARYAGVRYTIDNEEYQVINETDVAAILEVKDGGN